MSEIRVRLGARDYRFRAGEVVALGRDPSAEVPSENPYVSKLHAKLTFEDGTWVFEDAGSKRGVFHRGAQVSRLEISGPTELWLGPPNQGERIDLRPHMLAHADVPPNREPHTGAPEVVPDSELVIRARGGDYAFSPGKEVVIGRDPSADVTIENPYVSKQHARARYEDGRWVVEDAASKRGLFDGGARVSHVQVDGPIVVWFGPPGQGEKVEFSARPVAGKQLPGLSREGLSRTRGLSRRVRRPAPDLRVRLSHQDYVFSPGQDILIGRDPGADVQSHNAHVSREHATIRFENGAWTLEDSSSRGTFEGGQAVKRLRISEGTTLLLGDPTSGERLDLAPAPYGAAGYGQGLSTIVRELRRGTRRAVAAAVAAVVLIVGLAFGGLLATGALSGPGDSSTGTISPELVAKLEKSVVLIEALDKEGRQLYIGSGTIIRRDGMILTNAHVAAPHAPGLKQNYGLIEEDGSLMPSTPAAFVISIFQSKGHPAKPTYVAEAVAWDGWLDAAVMRITADLDGNPVDAASLNLPAVPLGDSRAVEDNEPLVVIGYPGVGGGFERVINTEPGTSSGFIKDDRVGAFAWLKTSAKINGGNSGGLAANANGELIGLPTQAGCYVEADCQFPQGRIRPVHVARNLIEAGLQGDTYETPWIVRGSGRESFDLLGLISLEDANQGLAESCDFEPAAAYQEGTTLVLPVLRPAGLTKGEDWAALLTYRENENAEPVPAGVNGPHQWDGTESCVLTAFEFDQGFPAGTLTVSMFAGPELVDPVASFDIPSAGSDDGSSDGGTGTEAGPAETTAAQCASFDPTAYSGTGVEMEYVTSEDGEVTVEAGTAALTNLLGSGEGYATIDDADLTVLDRVDEWVEAARSGFAKADTVSAVKRGRWIVLEASGMYYAYEAELWKGGVEASGGGVIRGPGDEGGGSYPAPPNYRPTDPDFREPCVIGTDQGAVVSWHALDYAGDPSEKQLWRYDSRTELFEVP